MTAVLTEQDMNSALGILLCVSMIHQSSDVPRIRRLSVVSKYSTEIVFRYASPILVENQSLRSDAVECFLSVLKSTGLYTDVRVIVKRRIESG